MAQIVLGELLAVWFSAQIVNGYSTIHTMYKMMPRLLPAAETS